MKAAAVGIGLLLCTMAGSSAQMNSADLKWGPAPPQFAKGAQMAVLAGDPAKPGEFVVRMKMPAGYRIAAHHHPTDEYITVIKGDLSVGMGDKLDTTKGTALKAGGFAVAPANMNHYVWSKKGAVVQVSAQGPFAIIYVDPADDPSKPAAQLP
jgi:quercetin dioxygenase-like cupin family protein